MSNNECQTAANEVVARPRSLPPVLENAECRYDFEASIERASLRQQDHSILWHNGMSFEHS
jgi:hypothetical protein